MTIDTSDVNCLWLTFAKIFFCWHHKQASSLRIALDDPSWMDKPMIRVCMFVWTPSCTQLKFV